VFCTHLNVEKAAALLGCLVLDSCLGHESLRRGAAGDELNRRSVGRRVKCVDDAARVTAGCVEGESAHEAALKWQCATDAVEVNHRIAGA
jgi:hypothetical protein